MRKLNKILTIFIFTCLCVLNFSFAADNSDCGKFATLSYIQTGSNEHWFNIVTQSWETDKNNFSNFLSTDQQSAIITNADLNTAMLNLQKYCCENELWWLNQKSKVCIDSQAFFNDNVLESPYLFDHLFDVTMRRLSWLTGENDIYQKTNMTTDDKWTQWRQRITEKIQSTWWSTPQIIIDKYTDTRKQSSSDLGYNISSRIYASFGDLDDNNFLKYVSGQWSSKESKEVAKAIKNYDKRTLYDRYINACAMTEYFYSLLHIWIKSDDRSTTINRVSNWVCHNAVNAQISSENSYVKLVIQQSSNLFLANYIQWYMNYLIGRSNTVMDKQQKIKDWFLDIVNDVPQLVRQCVHW